MGREYCTALTLDCGRVVDDCGAVVECGACEVGAICRTNRCESCAPIECADLGATCGVVDTACGEQSTCGECRVAASCSAQLECVPSDCGNDCPSGFVCDAEGVCVGESEAALVLDLPTTTVRGVLTENGSEPTPDSAFQTRGCIRLTFTDLDRGNQSIDLSCTEDAWGYERRLPTGRYRVTADGFTNMNDVPEQVVVPELVLDRESQLNLDVVARALTELRLGVFPCAELEFAPADGGELVRHDSCSADVVLLPPATYRVEAVAPLSSFVRPLRQVISDAEIISGRTDFLPATLTTETVILDVTPTINGAAIEDEPFESECIGFDLERTDVAGFTLREFACDLDDFVARFSVPPGPYRLSAFPAGERVNPFLRHVVVESLDLTSSRQLPLDFTASPVQVALQFTANGERIPGGGCHSFTLESLETGDEFFNFICGSADWSKTIELPVGSYRITGTGDRDSPHLPPFPQELIEDVFIDRDRALHFDFRAVFRSVEGELSLNGARLRSADGCFSVQFKPRPVVDGGLIFFTETCDGAYATSLWAGDYDVLVEPSGGGNPVDYPSRVVFGALALDENVVFDLNAQAPVSRVVPVTLLLNGALPSGEWRTTFRRLASPAIRRSVTLQAPAWQGALPLTPGVYEVRASGEISVDLSGSEQVLIQRIEIE